MPQQPTPRIAFPVDLNREEYARAALIAARQSGSLRSAPLILVAAALLVTVGLFSFGWFASLFLRVAVAALFGAAGILLFLVYFVMEPAGLRRQAYRDYETYRQLMAPAEIQLFADYVRTVTPTLTLTDQYALLAICVETPELIVLMKDRERMLIVPKRCIPGGQREETLEFLRLVFVRRRRVMRNWLF